MKYLLTYLLLCVTLFAQTTIKPLTQDNIEAAITDDADFITSLGGTTAGKALFQLPNPSAITFPRINADNTVSALSAADTRTALELGTAALLDVEDVVQPGENVTSPSTILFHDSGFGDAASIANGGTRTVEPGPGTLTATVANNSIVRYDGRGRGIISVIGGTGSTLVSAGAQTVAAGLTVMAKVIPTSGEGQKLGQTCVGFGHSASTVAMRRGGIRVMNLTGQTYTSVNISSLTTDADDGENYSANFIQPGEEIALCVHYKNTSHQQYFIQAPALSGIGCHVGSDQWMLLGETFSALSGTVYPYVGQTQGGTVIYRDFKVLSAWSPSERNTLLDFNRTDSGTHIPSLARDPVSGLVVAGWNRGTSHVGQGMSAIRYSVRLEDGSWTTPSSLIAAPSAPAGQSIQSLSVVNGALYLVYWKSTAGQDGGTLYWRTVSINAETGAATLGTETLLGVAGSDNLNFSPIVTLPSGRLVLPYHKTADQNLHVAWSDDDGATWSVQKIGSENSNYEPTLVIESDGALGCYLRTSGGSAEYRRCPDPEGAITTWDSQKTITSIPQPGANGSRMQALKLTDGTMLVVGNDHKAVRRRMSVWRVGDNAQVFEKTLLLDYNPPSSAYGAGVLQYPALLEDGDDLLVAVSRQPSSTATAGIGIQVDRILWTKPIDPMAGGTGKRNDLPALPPIKLAPKASIIAYSTTPTINCLNGDSFYITLTASTATLQPPTHMFPWQEITLVVQQGGTGSYTMAFDAIFQFNGITPSWRTAVGESNVLKAIFNEQTNKWVVTSFN